MGIERFEKKPNTPDEDRCALGLGPDSDIVFSRCYKSWTKYVFDLAMYSE